jgi:hypothetical protein
MIRITKEKIDQIFEVSKSQGEVLISLYRIAFPDFDDIKFIDGWPSISRDTSRYIADKFKAFDREHHPNVIAGGLWLSNGFSCSVPLKRDWILSTSKCKIIYHEQQKTKEAV